MASKVLSIEIGYFFTKVCEMDYQGKKPKIYNSFVIPTPNGLLQDGMLELENNDFATDFKNILIQKKIRTKAAIITISSSKIATREIRIPYCKENKIEDIVRSNLSDYFPIDVSQYMVAHSILEVEGVVKSEGEKSKKEENPTGYRLLLLAVPTQIIESYRRFATAAGLDLKEIDYNGNSLYQASKDVCLEGTQLVIKVDERSSALLVQRNGVIVLNRTIPYGIEEAVSALIDTKSWGELRNYEDALAVAGKETCILPNLEVNPQEEAQSEPDSQEEGAFNDKRHVTTTLFTLINGISKVIDYYNANHLDEPIEKMYITGVGADFMGLPALLSNEVGFEITKLATVAGISAEKMFVTENYGEYVSCIGAALSPVHFCSDKDEKKGKNKGNVDSVRIALVFCISCFVAGIIMIIAALVPYISEKKKEKEYNAIIEELQPAYDVYLDYQSVLLQSERMKMLDAQTINRNEDLVSFINILETNMPSGFCLNDMTATATGIIMNVTVRTKEEAASVLEELSRLDSFIFVDTTSLSEVITEIGETQYSFSVELTYAPIEETKALSSEGEE